MKQNGSQVDNLYAVFFGLIFVIIVGFILTVHFWENIIFVIYTIDYKVAKVFNYYFNLFTGYEEINQMVHFADIPKFNFFKLKFEYQVSSNYIDVINNFYQPLHYLYTGIIIFFTYLFLNDFSLIPTFHFYLSGRLKKQLVESAKKRIKIKNKKIQLYDHQKVLSERKRNPAKIKGSQRFLNADYLVPFIVEDQLYLSDNQLSVDTNKEYINSSLFFSKHYINKFYYLSKTSDMKDTTIDIINIMIKFFNDLEKKIKKKKAIKDIYYYNLLKYYNNKDINKYISLFTFNSNSPKKFNDFLFKYFRNNNIQLKILTNDIDKKNEEDYYYINKNEEYFITLKPLSHYIFINNDIPLLNLEEVFILFKVMNNNLFENKSYFFQSNEKIIEAPLILFPTNLDRDISMAAVNDLEIFKSTISSLKDYIDKKTNFKTLEIQINKFNTFNNEKDKFLHKIYNQYLPILIEYIENTTINNEKLNHLLSNEENKEYIKSFQNLKNMLNNKSIENSQLFFDYYYNILSWLYSISINEDNQDNIQVIVEENKLIQENLKKKQIMKEENNNQTLKTKWVYPFKIYFHKININEKIYIVDYENMLNDGYIYNNGIWEKGENKKNIIDYKNIDSYQKELKNITNNVKYIEENEEIYAIGKNEKKINVKTLKFKKERRNILIPIYTEYKRKSMSHFKKLEMTKIRIKVKEYIPENDNNIEEENGLLTIEKEIEINNLPTITINYINNFERIKKNLLDNYNTLIEYTETVFKDYENYNGDFVKIEGKYIEIINKSLNELIYSLLMKIEMYYKYGLEFNTSNENDIKPKVGQPVMTMTTILTPFVFHSQNKTKKLFDIIKDFKTQGFQKYILPVFEEIYHHWFANIEELVSFYRKELEDIDKNLDTSEDEKMQLNLKFSLLEREAQVQKTDKSSIETKLEKIMKVHHYEETIIIAVWKELTKYENLPTTKLSNLKYDNFVLWYALTCIGDVIGDTTIDISVIGRPFDYNAGLPITLMYELEKREYNLQKNDDKNIIID